jgi:tRNA(His) guanylyltransferase
MSRAPDDLGDRMKGYEEAAEGARLDVMLPVYARIDGRSFSKFTRGLDRPYDKRLSDAMIATVSGLVDATHARLGYTQSDEISLVYQAEMPESDILFNGRSQKLISVLAAMATALFTRALPLAGLGDYAAKLPHFDCRVCSLPSRTEAANMFLWRWKDSTKNAISMVAQANFSPKQLHGKHGGEMIEMLRERGIDFGSFPAFFRRGTFARRVLELRELGTEELARIPEKHRPVGPVQRHRIDTFTVEDFFGMDDREGFIFNSER